MTTLIIFVTLMLASSFPVLQSLMDYIVKHSERFDFYLNISKTKLLKDTDGYRRHAAWRCYRTSVIYKMGTLVNQQRDARAEFKSRIEQIAISTLTSGLDCCAVTPFLSFYMDASVELLTESWRKESTRSI